jgi:3-oxoacyl-[acyl-carrier protein] reductase
MQDKPVMIITGTSRGIGNHLARHYCENGYDVVGFSRAEVNLPMPNYRHFAVSVSDEEGVKKAFRDIRRDAGRLDVLVNNAGIAAMNHCLLTPLASLDAIYETNVKGVFLFCREAAKLMKKRSCGRIVNFTSVAVPLKLAGEAAYASSKAAVVTLSQVLAKELADLGITVNAIGPAPVSTDLIKGVPTEKIDALLQQQVISRYGEYRDITNVIDFFINPASDFITGQTLFLGGVS